MNGVEATCIRLRASFDERNLARERALSLSREIVRTSANAIRRVHAGEEAEAGALIVRAAEAVRAVQDATREHRDLYHAGYVHDAQKEYVEAAATLALVHERPVPEPEELGVEFPAYLNGLGEAVGELRRHILDRIRAGEIRDAERKLQIADDVYYALLMFDYPEALTGGLRRTVDAMRGILERTRGDVTNALRQLRLEQALERAASPPAP